ncbi:DUF1684 domain-containing protein [Parenemella sanctibonifatiensis]|uniref:DUF1684 domain-containing protein n=1 Tax=Parenemella sanctibonifatiensis TaxID=2016505 RepID=A0A255E8W5_9ACTN|nr:DUF1684 domain-containing protein [Parenemella sanctibonifatiensis]OYN87956.1 hypothetical protein CGZ92_06775 [Parenemella sanctibonifatiensis]
MSLSPEYRQAWEDWHARRLEELNGPYGWRSLTNQSWLSPGESLSLEGIPGTWSVEGDEVIHTPDDSGEFATLNGEPITEPTAISTGRKYSLEPAYFGDLRIETIQRRNADGTDIFGVRVRDPKEAASKVLADIDTYPLDERWVVPARFVRTPDQPSDYPTVERGVFEEQIVIGQVSFTLEGQEIVLAVAGRPDDDTGIERGNAHFTDLTSGNETYGNGRILRVPDIETDGETTVDFNRAISFPCAFTNYVTCPLPPPQNRIELAVTAGEKNPPVTIERIQTYGG